MNVAAMSGGDGRATMAFSSRELISSMGIATIGYNVAWNTFTDSREASVMASLSRLHNYAWKRRYAATWSNLLEW